MLVTLVALWPGEPFWRRRWAAVPGRWLRRRWQALARWMGAGAAAAPAGAAPAGPAPACTAPSAGADAAVGAAMSGGAGAPEGDAGPERAAPATAGPAGPPHGRWRPRLRARAGTALVTVAAACCLLLAGLWLGGYPGAVIFTAATALSAAAVSYRRAHRWWYPLSRPWVVSGLVVAAAACAVAGGQLLLAGVTGPAVTVLVNTAPQVLCLIATGRLAAALIVGDP